MEDGQKIKIALDSVLDSNTADMLCDINNPKLIFNRQVLQGGYLPTSVRFEHNGWFCGEYGYDYSIAAEEPINGGILGDILVSKKSNYINCIYHCKSDDPEIQFDVYPETRIIKKEHYDYNIEHIFGNNAHILKITGKTAILNNNYTFYIDITDLNDIKPARKAFWENVDPNINNEYFTTCHFMTEDLFKSGVYYTRKLVNGRLQYTIANKYSETEAYYKRIPVSNKFSFDPDKYIYSFKVYDQDKTFSDTISIYFGKTFYIGDDVYTYSMQSNNIKWAEYISCIYADNKLTMVTIEDSSDVQDVTIENGNGMLEYAIDITATDTINITVDDYFMDINFSSGGQQKAYIGNTPTDNNDNTITSNYWYADFFNTTEGITCEVKLPVWIGLGVSFYGQKMNTGSTVHASKYAQADVSNLYAIVHIDHYKNGEKQYERYYAFDNFVLDRFVLNNICTSPKIGYMSIQKATIDYNAMPAAYKNAVTLDGYMNIYKCKNHIIYVSTTGGNVIASRYNYHSPANSYDLNSDTGCTVTEIHDLIHSDYSNFVNTWYARFNEMHPMSTVAISGVGLTHEDSVIEDKYVLSKLLSDKLIGYNYRVTPGYKNSNKLAEYIFSFLSKNERLIKYDPVLHNAAIYPKPKTIPSYVPAGILDCTQGDPTMAMSYGKYYGSEDMVKAALNTFDFSSLIAIDASWQTVADKYTLEKLAKVQIIEDGKLNEPYSSTNVFGSSPWVNDNTYIGSTYEECEVDYSIENFWPFSKVPCFNLLMPDGTVARHIYYANEKLTKIIDNLEEYKAFIKNGSSFINLPFVDNNTEGFRVYDKLFYDHTKQQHAYTTDFDTGKLNLYADAFGYVDRTSLDKLDITVTYNNKTYNVFSDEVLEVTDQATLGDYYIYRSKLATHIDMLGTTTKDVLGNGRYLKSPASQEVAIEVGNGKLQFVTTIVTENGPTDENVNDDILFYIMYDSSLYSGFVYTPGTSTGPVNFDKYFRPVRYENTMYMNFSPRCIEPYILSFDDVIYKESPNVNDGFRKLDGTLTCDSKEHYALYNSKTIYITDPIYPYDNSSAYISLVGPTKNDYIIDLIDTCKLQYDIHSLCIINTEDSIFSCSVKYDSKNSISNDYIINGSENKVFRLSNVFAYGSHYLNRIHSIIPIPSYNNNFPNTNVVYYAYNGSAISESNPACRQTTTYTFRHLLDYWSSSGCHINEVGAVAKKSYSDSQLSFSNAYVVVKFFKEPSPMQSYDINYFCKNYGGTAHGELTITNSTACSFYFYNTDNKVGSLIAPLYYQHILHNDEFNYDYVDYAITSSGDALSYIWIKQIANNLPVAYYKSITLNDGDISDFTIGTTTQKFLQIIQTAHFEIVEGILLENKNTSISDNSLINYDVKLSITYDTNSDIGKRLIKSNDYSNISYTIKANLAYNIYTGVCDITNATYTDENNMFYKTLLSNSTKVTPITEVKKGINNSTIYMAIPVWGYGKFTIDIDNNELDSKSSNIFDIKEADDKDRDPMKLWIDKDISGSDDFNSVTGIKCISYDKGDFYPVNVADWTDTIQMIIIHADNCWFYYTANNDAVPSYINGNSNLVSGSDGTCASSMLGSNETLINTHWNIANYKMLLAASVNTTCAYYHNLCCVQGIHAYNAEIVFANRQQAIDGRITRDNYTPSDQVYINVMHVDSKFDYMLAYDMTNGTLDYKNIYESVNNIIDPEDTTNGEVSNE